MKRPHHQAHLAPGNRALSGGASLALMLLALLASGSPPLSAPLLAQEAVQSPAQEAAQGAAAPAPVAAPPAELADIVDPSGFPAADPTSANAEMEEVLRALRQSGVTPAAGGAPAAAATPTVTRPSLELVGWVVPSAAGVSGGGKAAAIIALGNSFHVAQAGQSVVASGWTLDVVEVSANRVLVRDGTSEIVLGSDASEEPGHLRNDLAVVEFREVPLSLAARALSDATGIRMAVSTEARAVPVSLYLRGVTGDEAIDSLVLTHGLYLSKVPGADIARIHTGQEYARDANSFLEERTQVFTLKYPNARDVALSIRDLFGDRVRLSARVDDRGGNSDHISEDLQQRMERFDVIDARGQGFGIDPRGGGGGGGAGFGGGRSITSRSLDNTRSFARGSDARSFGTRSGDPERMTFGDDLSAEEIASLEAGDPDAVALLVQARADIHVTAIDRLNKVMVRTRDEKTMQEICELVKSIDVPTPLVLLEVKIMEVALERGLDSAFDWSFQAGNVTGSFAPGGPAPRGDLVFTHLSDSFQAQIDFLQRGNKLTMLGKPMLLTANNEVSRLFIGEEVPLNRNFQGGQTLIADGTPILSAANTDIEFRPVGSTLLITPNINEDRTVSLRVLQEESRVVQSGADILVPATGGGFVNQSIDTVASQTASGTFVARDRETIAIGGMITEKLVSRRSQIPVLGDIPVVGILARNQSLGRERKEIVLLLTPHIIKTPGEGEAISRRIVEENSFHPNAPDGEGQLDAFVRSNVLTTRSEEFGPLDRIQERQEHGGLRAEPVFESGKSGEAPESKGFFQRLRSKRDGGR